MDNGKIGTIQPASKVKTIPFRSGDAVEHPDLGNGIVVGFSSISGEPHVFFYSRQQVLCLGAECITRG